MSFMEAPAQACEGHLSAPVAAMTLATPDARIFAELSAKAMGSTSVTNPPSTWVTFGSGALPTCTVTINISSFQMSSRGAMASDTSSAWVSCRRGERNSSFNALLRQSLRIQPRQSRSEA